MPFAITVTKKKKEKKAAAADSSRLRFTRLRNVLMLTTDCAATVCRGLVASGGDCRTKTKDRIRFALASVRPTPRTHSFCARLLFKIADCVKFAGRMCVCASRVCVGCAHVEPGFNSCMFAVVVREPFREQKVNQFGTTSGFAATWAAKLDIAANVIVENDDAHFTSFTLQSHV